MNTTIMVDGMMCNHCKEAVEGALKALAGVESAAVDLEAKCVAVTYDESAVTVDAMREAIEEQGYDVE